MEHFVLFLKIKKNREYFTEIRALGIEIIATQTTNRRVMVEFRFHELC